MTDDLLHSRYIFPELEGRPWTWVEGDILQYVWEQQDHMSYLGNITDADRPPDWNKIQSRGRKWELCQAAPAPEWGNDVIERTAEGQGNTGYVSLFLLANCFMRQAESVRISAMCTCALQNLHLWCPSKGMSGGRWFRAARQLVVMWRRNQLRVSKQSLCIWAESTLAFLAHACAQKFPARLKEILLIVKGRREGGLGTSGQPALGSGGSQISSKQIADTYHTW